MRRALMSTLLVMASSVAGAATDCPALLRQPFTPLAGGAAGDMCRFAGKVVLVVNTASRCAYTPQYAGLEALYSRYREAGLVVVGFPANDFGAQEPGSNEKIADFCETTYGVKFPLHAKTHVIGADAHPLYRQLLDLTGEAPGWNFHKYLIDHTGTQVVNVPSRTRPEAPALVDLIEARLAARKADPSVRPE
jgi:glutathione peroxidase